MLAHAGVITCCCHKKGRRKKVVNQAGDFPFPAWKTALNPVGAFLSAYGSQPLSAARKPQKGSRVMQNFFLCDHSVYPSMAQRSRNHSKPLELLLSCSSGGSQRLTLGESIHTQQRCVLCTWQKLLRICCTQRSFFSCHFCCFS